MRASRAWFACLLLLPTVACQGGTPPPAEPSHPGLPARSAPPAGMDESLRDAALELVETREQALVDGDRDAFLATIDPSAEEFARTQARWWDNVARLPATEMALALGDEGVMTRVHGEGDLQLPIDFTMRLDGYDEHAVTQPLIYTFVGDEDEVLLTSDRNLQNDALTGWLPAPWDVTSITVEESDGVLGVFDDETKDQAAELQDAIVAARDAIEPLVPPWSGRVVAYDISDVDAIDKMSSMSIDRTAGIAFPVMARLGGKKVAAHRFAVNPVHTDGEEWRGILLRHELVHVALGSSDNGSPRWLSEGVADYVAYSAAYDVDQRRRGLAQQLGSMAPRSLPTGRDFYQGRSRLNYALAHLACAYLTSTRGDDVLWDLMGSFRRRGAPFPADVEARVRAELGMSTKEIVADALAWARSA